MKVTDKIRLLERVRTLEGLTSEEREALIALINENKTYGLVWENKPEAVEKRLELEYPVLTEVPERAIISDNPEAPNHILIEGDNLEALTTLSYTHEGKIDVIYIDPPYNTGNGDFKYNDSFVDKEDAFRHSKWLSFISKRLEITKKLLSINGVIFISIDDNEQANLKILCDSLFGYNNYVGTIPTIMNLKGNQAEYGFAGTHEYTMVYTKQKEYCILGNLIAPDEELETWIEDEIGYYKKGATLKRTGADAPRLKRPYGYFPILIKASDSSVSTITKDEYKSIYDPDTKTFDDSYVEYLINKYRKEGYHAVLPLVNGQKCSWRWGFNTVSNNCKEIIVIVSGNDYSLYKKQRPELGDMPSKKPKSVLYKAQYSSGNGTTQLKDLGLSGTFNNPKPINLIVDLLLIGNCKDSYILDFFAGSGTTLHATMQLNAEDGGKRTCILCTNNENGICENVTYERNKRVIEGYTKPNGDFVEGLHDNNLRYYRTDFVSRERTQKNRKELMEKSTDLLCIKEDLYTEKNTFGKIKLLKEGTRYFENEHKRMLVIYQEELIPYFVEEIDRMDATEPIKVYVYARGRYAYDDEFAIVAEKVSLCALPQAIIDAMARVMPDNETEKATEPETSTSTETAIREESDSLFANLED